MTDNPIVNKLTEFSDSIANQLLAMQKAIDALSESVSNTNSRIEAIEFRTQADLQQLRQSCEQTRAELDSSRAGQALVDRQLGELAQSTDRRFGCIDVRLGELRANYFGTDSANQIVEELVSSAIGINAKEVKAAKKIGQALIDSQDLKVAISQIIGVHGEIKQADSLRGELEAQQSQISILSLMVEQISKDRADLLDGVANFQAKGNA